MTRRIRISGLVRTKNAVERRIAAPLTQSEKDSLRRMIDRAVSDVQGICGKHGIGVDHLPGPSRNAYAFLKSVDIESLPVIQDVDYRRRSACRESHDGRRANSAPRGGQVRIPTLVSWWQGLLDELGQPQDPNDHSILFGAVEQTSQQLEVLLKEKGATADELTRPCREAFDWLRFFSSRDSFEAYGRALRIAHPILYDAATMGGKNKATLIVCFRNTAGFWRSAPISGGARLTLPIPMIAFSEQLFTELANAMYRDASKESVAGALLGDACQSVRESLDAVSAVSGEGQGAHHDLEASCRRVVSKYFADEFEPPRLRWSSSLNARKLGYFSLQGDVVVVSHLLDHPEIPEFALDFVVYHELLHKAIGTDWRDGRMHFHTPEFREAEARFERFAEANAILERVCRQNLVGDRES